MSTWDEYKREESNRLEAGDYRVEIVSVDETTSKAGNPMLVLGIKPNGSRMVINHYIVKNDWFNRNMTQLFDSFNITEGDFNFLTWYGAVGAASLKTDDRGFLKVAWFLSKKKAEALPPWVGELPERVTVDSTGFAEVEPEDGLPF